MFRVAVLAGTPVDTRMGVEYIRRKNSGFPEPVAEPVYMPVAEDCDAQMRFQYSSYENKRKRIDEIFDAAIADGIREFFIYCNSLSGAFDFDAYAEEKSAETGCGINIYTPLQIYRKAGRSYSRVGVAAANNLSAYSVEKNLMSANEDIYMIGTGNMAVVRAIEAGLPPQEIIETCGLKHMVRYMEACGAEAIILGCTHFPYFREELIPYCSVPVIDPADEMFEEMVRRAGK